MICKINLFILLPKMNRIARPTNSRVTGVVIKERVKCGKPNCKCTRGELHGGYYYHYFRVFKNGKSTLKKNYVPKNNVKKLKQQIKQTRDTDKKYRVWLDEQSKFLAVIRSQMKESLS